jgi:hypothetical protein
MNEKLRLLDEFKHHKGRVTGMWFFFSGKRVALGEVLGD